MTDEEVEKIRSFAAKLPAMLCDGATSGRGAHLHADECAIVLMMLADAKLVEGLPGVVNRIAPAPLTPVDPGGK